MSTAMTIEQIFQPICDKIEANPLSTRFAVKEFFYHDILSTMVLSPKRVMVPCNALLTTLNEWIKNIGEFGGLTFASDSDMIIFAFENGGIFSNYNRYLKKAMTIGIEVDDNEFRGTYFFDSSKVQYLSSSVRGTPEWVFNAHKEDSSVTPVYISDDQLVGISQEYILPQKMK